MSDNRLLECWANIVRMLEDRILVWRFNRGDTAALCRIYEKYRDGLLKVAAALLNDKSDIEDVLHDVFVDFARAAGRFQLRGSLKGYLAICVANRARDRNRAMQRRSAASLDEVKPGQAQPEGPESTATTRELTEKMGEAMAQLPDEQRQTIVLRLQSKLRFQEIAQLQGVSVNTAQSRYRYGLDKLRASFNGELSHE
ncbi:MAG: sigma-70 family RNA polymerase sigma factor [Phycisphaerales bacterium]|nr:MAG: sigma-70 family RNA polymerase sigma factor [Phycisphaerales bacterium]